MTNTVPDRIERTFLALRQVLLAEGECDLLQLRRPFDKLRVTYYSRFVHVLRDF
jgi:hypothetical protein